MKMNQLYVADACRILSTNFFQIIVFARFPTSARIDCRRLLLTLYMSYPIEVFCAWYYLRANFLFDARSVGG